MTGADDSSAPEDEKEPTRPPKTSSAPPGIDSPVTIDASPTVDVMDGVMEEGFRRRDPGPGIVAGDTLDADESISDLPPGALNDAGEMPPLPPPPMPGPPSSALPPLPAPVLTDGPALPPDIPPPASVPAPRPYSSPQEHPAARVDEVAPDEGSVLGGLGITLHGDHLYRESIVRFGSELARTIGAQPPHRIKVESPPAKDAGFVTVSVQNPGAPLTELKKGFRYLPLPAPEIESVAPPQGGPEGGTEVSIIGRNFVPGTRVLLNGSDAGPVTVVDDTTLDFFSPPGRAGEALDITVVNPDGKEAKVKRGFVYDERFA
ncbi:MAG: IPT/TIG domain-containing protein [Myxococcota bacterium]